MLGGIASCLTGHMAPPPEEARLLLAAGATAVQIHRGITALTIAETRVVLPYDETFVGLSLDRLAGAGLVISLIGVTTGC